jgi:hypothetical protein
VKANLTVGDKGLPLGNCSIPSRILYTLEVLRLQWTDVNSKGNTIDFESNEHHSATAKTTEEAQKLIESGFEYVCTIPEETMLFRKTK